MNVYIKKKSSFHPKRLTGSPLRHFKHRSTISIVPKNHISCHFKIQQVYSTVVYFTNELESLTTPTSYIPCPNSWMYLLIVSISQLLSNLSKKYLSKNIYFFNFSVFTWRWRNRANSS